MAKKHKIPQKLQAWIEARKRYRLTHAQVQMARELGMNPKKLGGLANHRQEPWKAPLPQFIEDCYRKQFGRERPDNVLSIEEKLRIYQAKSRQKGSQTPGSRSRRLEFMTAKRDLLGRLLPTEGMKVVPGISSRTRCRATFLPSHAYCRSVSMTDT